MASAVKVPVEIDGRALALSNLQKVLWPADGITKGDLIAYYRAVAPWIVPHLRERPLTLQRFPDGIERASFFEKEVPRSTPEWVPRITLPSLYGKHENVTFIICNDEPTLVFVANLASIALHIWMSKLPNLERPDFMLVDLDPYECGIGTLARVALRFREALEEIGLQPLVKTTGGTGMHVVVPLQPRYDYEFVKGFGELVTRRVAALEPSLTTLERTIKKRPRGRVYLDWVQIGEGKTVVPAYSVRAQPQASVSMPLAWDDVEAMQRKRAPDTRSEMTRWTIRNVPQLLEKNGDPWSGKAWKPQRLDAALKRARTRWAG